MPGLYVHLPFCVKKCAYCDFVSMPGDSALRERYVQRVIEEIKDRGISGKRSISGKCDTVFFGGGTPSILDPEQTERILGALRSSFDIAGDAEITAEANPESLTFEKAVALKRIGVNRLSIGFQSLEKRALQILGRAHDAEQAAEAFRNARRAGFENINIDLIFGLPGEPEGEFETTLKKVLAMSPEHISAYSLIVEEGTPLCRDITAGRLPEPEDERDRKDYHLALEMLGDAGYRRYEISNFARPGFESKHNKNCWEQEEYIGFGPAAASFTGRQRYRNNCDITAYAEKGPVIEDDPEMTDLEMMKEYMMLGFRLAEGPDFQKFQQKYGKNANEIFSGSLKKLESAGLIERTRSIKRPYRLTLRGLDLGNIVFGEFV